MVIANNALWKGARGSLGGLVFQTWGDKVIVRSEPRRRKVPVEKQSRRQQLTRLNFKDATVYAKTVTRDREKKAYYAKKAKALGVRSAYSAAISDYMRGQTIESIDTRCYNGKTGGHVKITVRKKNFDTKEVYVNIKTEAGEIIEQGNAALAPNGAWIYNNQVETTEKIVIVEAQAMNWSGRGEKRISTIKLG